MHDRRAKLERALERHRSCNGLMGPIGDDLAEGCRIALRLLEELDDARNAVAELVEEREYLSGRLRRSGR